MTRLLLIVMSLGLVALAARAEDATPATEAPRPVPSSVDTVHPGLELDLTLSIVSPTELVLTNGIHRVPYGDSFAGLPAVQVGLAKKIFEVHPFHLDLTAHAGYGRRNAPVAVPGVGEQSISLDWVPMSAALRLEYAIAGLDFVRPSLSVGSGVHYLHQSGPAPGLTDEFWVPHVFFTPALTFMGGNPTRDWFNGFTFGVMLDRSVSTVQTVRGWSFDLSFSIFL